MKKILLLLMIAASLFAQVQDHPRSSILYITSGAAGEEGSGAIDPDDLSPDNWFDEGFRANNSWECKITEDTFGDGGATSYFLFTQNDLDYWETDAGFTPLFRNDATNWFTASETNFSFVMVHKTRVAGSTTDKRLFHHSSDDAQAFWELRRNGELNIDYRVVDDVGNIMNAIGGFVVNDNAWYISIITVKNFINTGGVLNVYQSTGVSLIATDEDWVKSKYNGGLAGTFVNGSGGKNSTWTGTAEIIFYDDKILTLTEANGIGTWLSEKWDITWVNNTDTTAFFDDFESGTGNWTITNQSGTCVWVTRDIATDQAYTFPSGAAGDVLSADADLCGSGSQTNTTATMNTGIDATGYTNVWVEFDNDWRALTGSDLPFLEISIDGGTIWAEVFGWITDRRSTETVYDISSVAAGESDVKLRLRVVQPGWDWYWAVDNFTIKMSN